MVVSIEGDYIDYTDRAQTIQQQKRSSFSSLEEFVEDLYLSFGQNEHEMCFVVLFDSYSNPNMLKPVCLIGIIEHNRRKDAFCFLV